MAVFSPRQRSMLDAKASKGARPTDDVGGMAGADARSLLELGLIVDRNMATASGDASALASDLDALREASVGDGPGSLKTTVENNYSELSGRVSGVSGRVSELEGENLDARLSSIEDASLPSRVSALEQVGAAGRLSELEHGLSSAESDISGLRASMAGIASSVAELSAAVSALSSALAALTSRVTALEAALTTDMAGGTLFVDIGGTATQATVTQHGTLRGAG